MLYLAIAMSVLIDLMLVGMRTSTAIDFGMWDQDYSSSNSGNGGSANGRQCALLPDPCVPGTHATYCSTRNHLLSTVEPSDRESEVLRAQSGWVRNRDSLVALRC